MNIDDYTVHCSACSSTIVIPPKWYGKKIRITCGGCKAKWEEKIPDEMSIKGSRSSTDELLEGVEDFLSNLDESAREFLGFKKK